MTHTILRLPQVKLRVGLSRSSIYLAVFQGKFPRPVSLGVRAVGWLEASSLPERFDDLILRQTQRWWNIHITRQISKGHFLRYAVRYIRRLPISQRRILQVTEQEVVYQNKDTRTKTLVETRCTPAEFLALLSQHVLNRKFPPLRKLPQFTRSLREPSQGPLLP